MSVSASENNPNHNHEVNGGLETEDVDPIKGPENLKPNSDEMEGEKVNGVTNGTEDPKDNFDEMEMEEIIAGTKSPEKPGQNSDKKEVEKIIGVTSNSGEMQFGIKFKGIEEYELVSRKEANVLYPEHVIEYYESRIIWETASNTYENTLYSNDDDSFSTDEWSSD